MLNSGDFSVDIVKSYFDNQSDKFDMFTFFDANGKAVGYIGVMYKGGREIQYKVDYHDALIFDVCIFTKYRGRGYCGVMLNQLGKYLYNKGIKEVCLGVRKNNSSAIKAYSKFGFDICGERKFVRILRVNIPYCTV